MTKTVERAKALSQRKAQMSMSAARCYAEGTSRQSGAQEGVLKPVSPELRSEWGLNKKLCSSQASVLLDGAGKVCKDTA